MAQSDILCTVNQTPTKEVNAGIPAKPTLTLYDELRVKAMDSLGYTQAGQIWIAKNPTSGTGIASHAAPTATDGSKPLFTINNSYASGTDKHIYLQSIQFGVTVAGANATSSRFYVEKSASGVSRFTSGGSTNLASTAIVANNTGTSSIATSAVVRLGAVVAPTDANAKLLWEGSIRAIIPKVSDQIILDFGDVTASASATLLDISNTSPILSRFRMPAVDLAPGETFLFHLVNAAQDAASSYTMQAVWIER